MRRAAIVLLALAATACEASYRETAESADVAMVAPRAPAAAPAVGEAAASAQDASASAPAANVPVAAPMLAYSYRYGLLLPPGRVREVVGAHEAACVQAGFRQCQVVSSSVTAYGEEMRAELVMRAAPGWLGPFRQRLAKDVQAADGRVLRSEVDSEDLSRQIVDVEATLRAKTALRDRLQVLLASRPGKLSELLEVERELARVQGELDSIRSQLAVLRGRVATSEITLTYESQSVLAPSGAWRPLADAAGNFIEIVALSLSAMLVFAAWTLPWLLLLAAVLWLFRSRLRRPRWPWGRRKAPPT